MALIRTTTRACWLLLLLQLAVQALAAESWSSAEAVLESAIDELRTSPAPGSRGERRAQQKAQEDAIVQMFENPELAGTVVRRILAAERSDSRFAIGLAGLLLTLEEYSPATMREVGSLLAWVDPNKNPNSFYSTAFEMARACGPDCLPAVLKLLELEELAFPVALHAMWLDVDRGLEFALGQYGDDALSGVFEALSSGSCTVQRNAAFALTFLLPSRSPSRLAEIAAGGGCPEARPVALVALGSIDDASLPAFALDLVRSGDLSDELKSALVQSLALSFNPAVLEPLGHLAADASAQIAERAKRAIEHLRTYAPVPAEVVDSLGSASDSERAALLEALKTTVETSRWEPRMERGEVVARLQVTDIDLVNAARAAVLRRLSDECLYEYNELTYLARTLSSATKDELEPLVWTAF